MLNQTISQYKVVAKIGQGGMGEVYKAEDTLLRRMVALKVLSKSTQHDEGLKRRFLREARAASALNHPGIITIHEVLREGETDVIVMELVEGRPLDKLIVPGGLPVERARAIARQIAEAVAAAHAAGIVHRDLKPANVMVLADDRVKVLDFGLAKQGEPLAPGAATSPTLTQREALTRLGAVFGTLQYMSPEQALGEPADARSDVFSLGVILYEMLTGERPFDATNAASLLHHVAYTEPQPARGLRDGLPPDLERALDRALAKKPEERFQTMAEAAEALKPAPSTARSPLAWKMPAALLALALLLLAVPQTREVLNGWLGSAPAALAERDPATLNQNQLLELGRELLVRYDRSGHVDRAIEAFQIAITKDPEYAPAYAGIGLARWRKYRLEKDPSLLEAARASAERSVELAPLMTGGRVALALIQIAGGDRDAAKTALDDVLLTDPGNADAHRGLGDISLAANDLQRAESSYLRALERRPNDWELMLLVGYVQMRQAKYADAEVVLRRAVETVPDNPSAYRNLAAALHYQDRYAEAATVLQEALELQPRADVYTNLGTLYFFQGLYEQAVTSFERALDLDANHFRTWANLADAYRWTAGREGDAIETYRRAIQLIREQLDISPDDNHLRTNLALYLAKSGQLEAARGEIERVSVPAEPSADDLYRAAVVWEICGFREKALELVERALDVGYSRSEIEHDPELARLRADVGYHRVLLKLDSVD